MAQSINIEAEVLDQMEAELQEDAVHAESVQNNDEKRHFLIGAAVTAVALTTLAYVGTLAYDAVVSYFEVPWYQFW